MIKRYNYNKTKKNNSKTKVKSRIKVKYRIKTKSKKFRKNKRIHKNHYKRIQPLKGGDIKGIHVKNNFEDIPNANDYELIYIAIGAKYHTNYPSNMINTGEYQLMPNFLTVKSLIIIIDTFSDEELELTKSTIRNQYLNSKDSEVDNFDIFIINHLFDREISEKIVRFLSTRENTKINLWICNYVVFLSPTPSPMEKEIEKTVDQNCNYIANINDKQLEKNVYKWLGNFNYPKILSNKSNYISVLYILSKRSLNQKEKGFLKKNILDLYSYYFDLLE